MPADGTEKRQVLLGISGSIAAYKSVELARLLVSWGYDVRVVMTQTAQKFITPATMTAITGHPVHTQFWDDTELCGIGHIRLADWAQTFVVAPATADVIARLAHGMADTPLLAMALATRAPVLLAPAMNVNMYEHTSTQENISILRSRGVHFIPPEEGELACGWNGTGRMASSQEIFYHIRRALSSPDYKDKRVVITTGPTREHLDPVRFLTNKSSGKMGISLAREAFRRGAKVTLIHGPMKPRVPSEIDCKCVVSALDMNETVLSEVFGEREGKRKDDFVSPEIVIMAAAVGDYRPKNFLDQKIKKTGETLELKLVRNPDILTELGERKAKLERADNRPVLVGFAVETGEIEELLDEVREKLYTKKVDIMVGNLAQDAFELDTNRVWIVDKHGRQEEVATSYKSRVANRILDSILKV